MRTTENFPLRELHSNFGPACYTGLKHVTCALFSFTYFFANIKDVVFKLILLL